VRKRTVDWTVERETAARESQRQDEEGERAFGAEQMNGADDRKQRLGYRKGCGWDSQGMANSTV